MLYFRIYLKFNEIKNKNLTNYSNRNFCIKYR